MATNTWRKIDWTNFSQWLRMMSKMANEWKRLVDDMYYAQNETTNTDPYSIAIWKWRVPWQTFTIKTKWWNLLKGVQIWKDGDIWTHFEFVDVKYWWEPIHVTASNKTDNKENIRALAHKYAFWNYWYDDINEIMSNISTPDIEYNWKSLDEELNKRHEALKQKYLNTFREYRKARPDVQWKLAPEVAKAIINYNNLIK